ncbi:MAG: fluoride efflux transporter CrcB [Prevotellaceae bacterium]|nr:fluoride efflux transporter CrcB [Prevotellaceae bacterium]
MLKNIIIVAVGGAIGSVARYLVSRVIQDSVSSGFPFGTMTVNIVGCLLIGFIGALAAEHGSISAETKLILTTGFCGGFTTFSTFMNESLTLFRTDSLLVSAIYVGMSVVLGLIAAAAGMYLGKMI